MLDTAGVSFFHVTPSFLRCCCSYDISNPTAAYGTGPEFQSFNAAVDGILQPEGITFAM